MAASTAGSQSRRRRWAGTCRPTSGATGAARSAVIGHLSETEAGDVGGGAAVDHGPVGPRRAYRRTPYRQPSVKGWPAGRLEGYKLSAMEGCCTAGLGVTWGSLRAVVIGFHVGGTVTTSPELPGRKSDVAYARVRELILSGDLVPGAVLNQAALAKEIGISTTPLREALRRLEQQGLVELDAHRDARVPQLDAGQARDLLEVRTSLDPLAAALAAERRTAANIAVMRTSLEGLAALPTNPTAAQLDTHRRFHSAIYRASHNAVLVGMLDALWDSADRYRRHGLEVERSDEQRRTTDREHELLVQAVLERDGETASAVMRAHVQTSSGARSAWRLASSTHAPS